MLELIFTIISFLFAVCVGAIPGFIYFDKLIKHLHENNYESWKKIGSPRGFFWQPNEEINYIESSFSTGFFSIKILLKTPLEIIENAAQMNFLKKYRIHSIFWYVGFIVFMISIAFLFPKLPARN